MRLGFGMAANSACWIWPRSQFAAEAGPFVYTHIHILAQACSQYNS